jgi:hypothetical protein
VSDGRLINECGAVGGMRIGRGETIVLGENLPSYHLSIINPT